MIGMSLVIIMAMATASLLVGLVYAVHQIAKQRKLPRGFEVKTNTGEEPVIEKEREHDHG